METPIQRWTAKRKTELVLQLLKAEKKVIDVCREYDLKQSEVESWIETFLKGGEQILKSNSKEQLDSKDREIKELRAKVGELVLELDARKKLEALMQSDEKTFWS